jgi:hypothetical protein
LRKLQIVGLELEAAEQIFISRRCPAASETNTAILTDVKSIAARVPRYQNGAGTESNIPAPRLQHKTWQYRGQDISRGGTFGFHFLRNLHFSGEIFKLSQNN